MKSFYNLNNLKSHLECNIFLDNSNDGVTIPRFESVKYPRVEKMNDKALSFFWRPEEVDLSRDKSDFLKLNEEEKHIFISNLKRQILLDGVQTRAPQVTFGAVTSLPEIESFIANWIFAENIHSRSYTHILRNIYSNPSEIFDSINDIKEIQDCAADITKNYEELYKFTQYAELNGYDAAHTKYMHKEKIWMALVSVNILEGLRFYVSFACSWAFAERKKMEGNAKIIKFIARDENLHLGFTQFLLNILPEDDKDFKTIKENNRSTATSLYMDAIAQEKKWATYLFNKGSMIGLTEQLLCDYMDWLGKKRMDAIDLKFSGKSPATNPLPWTQSWIAGKDVQNAPQEVEISSYLTGGLSKTTGRDEIINNLKDLDF